MFLEGMTEPLIRKPIEDFDLGSRIDGFYVEENLRSIRIRIHDKRQFWVPKEFIDSKFFREESLKQEFVINKWVLREIDFEGYISN